MEQKSLVARLFDLSFSEFITTQIIKLLFILGVILSGFWSIGIIVTGFSTSAAFGVLMLLVSPLIFLLLVLGTRIWCEMTIVIFRIADNTNSLVQQKETGAAKSASEEG